MKTIASLVLGLVLGLVFGTVGATQHQQRSEPNTQSLQQTIDRLQIELKAANDELSRQPDQSALLGQARWAKEELEFLQDRIKTLGLRLPTSSLEQAKNR